MKNIKIVILLVLGLQLETVVKPSFDSKGAEDATAKLFGQTELHMAAGHQSIDDSRIEFVAQLIDEGAAIDSLDNCGQTPLFLAALYGNAGIARLLIMNGADIKHQSNNGGTPLHMAVTEDQIKCIELLIEIGANLDLKNKNGQTPLHYAVLYDCSACARLLLEAGANHNLKNKMGRTPGQLISNNNGDEMLAIFIQAGIDNPAPAAAECCTIS